MDTKVKKVIALVPIKPQRHKYLRASKLVSDKLFMAGNNIKGDRIWFSCVRYGNVMGSRVGNSIIPREITNWEFKYYDQTWLV